MRRRDLRLGHGGELKQHHALYPSWGPEPWGSKLAELAKTLGVEGAP